MRGRRSLFTVLVLAVAGIGCDTAIYGEVEPAGPALRVVEGTRVFPSVSVGVLGEDALIQWMDNTGENALSMATWVDPNLSVMSPSIPLGEGGGWASRWVPDHDGLIAQVWTSPVGAPRTRSDAAYIRLASRASEIERTEIPLDVIDEPGFTVLTVRSPTFASGAEAKLPFAIWPNGERVAAIGGRPSSCGEAAPLLVHLISGSPPRATPTRQEGNLCAPVGSGSPWLFRLGATGVGLLFRGEEADGEDGRLRFAPLAPDGTLAQPSVLVGGPLHGGVGGGWQPRAAWVDDRVLFTERRAGENKCHALRVMDDDGSGAHDAPWQLPCFGEIRFDPSQEITAGVELLAVEGGVLLVYSEHAFAGTQPVTRDFPWHEGIYAVLLDRDGRRGSEIVRVTDDGATAIADWPRTEDEGPYANSFWFGAAADGDRAVVVWTDLRADAPGVYARSLRVR